MSEHPEQNTQQCPRCGTVTDQPFHTCVKEQNTQRPSDEPELSREERPTVATGKIVWNSPSAPQTEAGDVEKPWTVDDPRMWKEQCRISDIAFQNLFCQFKGLPVPDWAKDISSVTALTQRIAELQAENERLKKLEADAGDEMLKLAARAAHYFVLNGKEELERLGNGYIGHIGQMQEVLSRAETAEARVKELEQKLAGALKVTTENTIAHMQAKP